MTQTNKNSNTLPLPPSEAQITAEEKKAAEEAAKKAAVPQADAASTPEEDKDKKDKKGFDFGNMNWTALLGMALSAIGLNFVGEYFGMGGLSTLLAIGGGIILGPALGNKISEWTGSGKDDNQVAQGQALQPAVGQGLAQGQTVQPVAKFTNEELLAALHQTGNQQQVLLKNDNNHYSLQGVTQADIAQGTKGIMEVATLHNIQAQCGAGADIALLPVAHSNEVSLVCSVPQRVASASTGRV